MLFQIKMLQEIQHHFIILTFHQDEHTKNLEFPLVEIGIKIGFEICLKAYEVI